MWPHYVQGESNVTLERFLIDHGDVVLLCTFTHTVESNGREFTTPSAMHLTAEDNSLVRMRLYEDTLVIEQAFTAA